MSTAIAREQVHGVREAGAPGAGRRRPKARTGQAKPTPKTPDLEPVWRAYKSTGDVALRNRLVEHYLYLVKVIGNRVASRLPRSIDVQDLRSAGVFGLMRAIENFDLDRGTPFESYCATRVRGAILDELRAQDWVPRLVRNRAAQYDRVVQDLRTRLGREPSNHEAATELGVSPAQAERMRRNAQLAMVYNLTPQEDREDETRSMKRLDVLMDRTSDVPFEQLVAHDLAHALVDVLEGSEKTVVALYYYEGLTMKEIGRVLGISESRVCQIHTKTLRKLKHSLEEIQEAARSRMG